MALSDKDVAVFFRDGDVCTTASGASARVYLTFPEDIGRLPGMTAAVVQGKPQMEFVTDSLDVKYGDTVTIKGQQYKMGAIRKQGDGRVSIADLLKA